MATKPRVRVPAARAPAARAPAVTTDALVNLTTGMGDPLKDKLLGSFFAAQEMSEEQLLAAYRGDWIARKCVDIPAKDMTREWRGWQADKIDITKIEELEKRLGIQTRTKDWIIRSRLYGGAALVLGVEQGKPEEELKINQVKRDSLKFVHVVSPRELTPGPLVQDLTSPYYGEPEYWTRNTQTDVVRIHPSRVAVLTGVDRPDVMQTGRPWGDSILQSVSEAVRAAGLTTNSIAQLVAETKIDIISMPGLSEGLMQAGYESRLRERFALANSIKSVYSMLITDKEEDWERLTVNFTGLPDILKMYLLIACGAVDIPATRFLGQSPAGLSATGESDLRNYYDSASSDQKTEVAPALDRVDQVLVRSALGAWPDGLFYEWNSLWQMTDEQKAELSKKKADIFKVDFDSGLFSPDVMRRARANQLIEDGTYPGLEQIIEDEGDDGAAIFDFNPHHEPAGTSAGGQFTSAPGGGGLPREEREKRRERAEKAGVHSYSKEDQERMLLESTDTLSKDEEKAIGSYSGVSYRDVNKELRSDNPNYRPGGTVGSVVDGLDSAFRKASLVQDLVTYRGLRAARISELRKAPDGTEFTDRGYVSTSMNINNASVFSDHSETIRIFLPKGSAAIPLNGLAMHPEAEVLIRRDSVFVKRTDTRGVSYLELKR